MIGKTILHYEIVEKLGQGGMGVVYKAHDTKLKRDVAIKFLPPQIAANEAERQRFKIEAQAAAALNHPNIAQVYAIEETDEQMFIVMEYIDGKELRNIVGAHRDAPLPTDMVIDLVTQIASGLQAAHEKGIVHRDIKSSNIMVTEDGRVKIMDFGLAKIGAGSQLTRDHSTLGTTAYMSPEQARSEEVDQRSDIWSFGVLMYEMLTATLPFKGDYEQAVLYAVINEPHTPVSSVNPDIEPKYEHLVNRMLEKDKEKRYQDLNAFFTDLENADSPGDGTVKSTEKGLAGTGNHLGWIAAAVLLVAFAAYFLFSPGQQVAERAVEKVTLLPFAFEGESGWNWLSLAVDDLIRAEIADYSTLHIEDAQATVTLLADEGLHETVIPDERLPQLAAQNGSDKIITGSISKNGDQITIHAGIFDTGEKVRLDGIAPVSGSTADLKAMTQAISSSLFNQLRPGIQSTAGNAATTKNQPRSLDAWRYFLEGRDAVYDQRHNDAISKLKKAIELDREYVDSYYWLAHEYSLQGNQEKAGEILKEGKSYISKLSEADRLRYLSNEAGIENRWQDYAGYLEKLLRLNPNDAVDHARYGWTLYKKFRKMDAGIRELEKAVALDSTYGWAFNTLGYAWLEKGDQSKALSMIDRYITLHPTDVDPLDSKAELLYYLGNFNEAGNISEQILATHPDHYSSQILINRIQMAQGKYSQAIASFDKIIEKAPDANTLSSCYQWQAECWSELGDNDKALEKANRAVEADKTNLQARWMQIRCFLNLGQTEKALAETADFQAQLLQQGGMDNRWLLYDLNGRLAIRKKEYGKAVDWYKKALVLFPRQRSFYLSELANAFLVSGKLDEAISNFQYALGVNKNYAPAYLGLGQAYEKIGEKDLSKQSFEKYLNILKFADGQVQGLQFAANKLKDFSR